jgi:hypothetical protein
VGDRVGKYAVIAAEAADRGWNRGGCGQWEIRSCSMNRVQGGGRGGAEEAEERGDWDGSEKVGAGKPGCRVSGCQGVRVSGEGSQMVESAGARGKGASAGDVWE